MKRVMLDTCYWIELKENPDRCSEFAEAVGDDSTEVMFSYGNFIDLAKADEEDVLSEIIAEHTDVYVPSMDYEGSDYRVADNPIGMVSDRELRQRIRRDSADFGEMKTLRFIFRVSDWDSDEYYETIIQNLKNVHDKFGFEQSKAALFPEYWRDAEDGKKLLYDDDIDVTEYVRKMVSLYRISMMQEDEKIDATNIADMEVCSQAILTDCDVLLIESKWKNLGLIEKVLSHLEGDHVEVQVLDNFEDLFQMV